MQHKYFFLLLNITRKEEKLLVKGVEWLMTCWNRNFAKVKGKTNSLMCPRKINSNTLSFILKLGAPLEALIVIYL